MDRFIGVGKEQVTGRTRLTDAGQSGEPEKYPTEVRQENICWLGCRYPSKVLEYNNMYSSTLYRPASE